MIINTYSKTSSFTKAMIAEAESKFAKLEKFMKTDEPVKLTIETFKKDIIRVKAQIVLKNNQRIREEVEGEDYYYCLNELVDGLKHQASTRKEKMSRRDRVRREQPIVEAIEVPVIKKVKHFVLENISEGMAMNEMEKLGHEFFIFKDIDKEDKVCALYKRVDGDYSLIVIED